MMQKTIDVLVVILEGEAGKPLGSPVILLQPPDRGSGGVEVPFLRRIEALLPVDAHLEAVTQVFGDLTDRLDRHDRNRLAAVIEGQIMLADKGRLDGDPVAWLHRPDFGLIAVLAGRPGEKSPDALLYQLIGLVNAAAEGSADKPVIWLGCGCHTLIFVPSS